MYYYLLALWILYGAIVVLYIASKDIGHFRKVNPLSVVILTIVAGPTMWLAIATSYLLSYLERKINR